MRGRGETVLESARVQAPVVNDEGQISIKTLYDHNGSRNRGLGGPNEAIREIRGDIAFHLGEFTGRHDVDRAQGWGCIGLQGYVKIIFAVREKDVGLGFREDV